MSRLYSIYREHPVVTTDSRTCPEGSIFIALKGESFDGNRFASQALANGCAYAVIDNPACAVEGDDRYILVDDALVAFNLNELPDTKGETVKLKLRWKAYSGNKSVEFDFCSRKATGGELPTEDLISAKLLY